MALVCRLRSVLSVGDRVRASHSSRGRRRLDCLLNLPCMRLLCRVFPKRSRWAFTTSRQPLNNAVHEEVDRAFLESTLARGDKSGPSVWCSAGLDLQRHSPVDTLACWGLLSCPFIVSAPQLAAEVAVNELASWLTSTAGTTRRTQWNKLRGAMDCRVKLSEAPMHQAHLRAGGTQTMKQCYRKLGAMRARSRAGYKLDHWRRQSEGRLQGGGRNVSCL